MEQMNPAGWRELFRQNKYVRPTAGLAPGYVQANLVVLPREAAFDFLVFCFRNPKPCPVLDVTDPGSPEPKKVAPGADLRTDLPLYRVFEKGVLVDEATDIKKYWRDDLVAFLLGCSFTFEKALLEAGIELRHITEEKNVAMYITNIECTPAGIFRGPLVVSMRPIKMAQVALAVQVTARFPAVHGAPVQVGNPAGLGIKDLGKPDFGEAVEILEGEVPVFWACGVTPQVAARRAKPELMITHAPGYMFITDLQDKDLSVCAF
ncbi:MAG: putative hydro-lyase [Firmicutes bacterium]|nr:putative hydro-lyase [Bacillota bacterium]